MTLFLPRGRRCVGLPGAERGFTGGDGIGPGGRIAEFFQDATGAFGLAVDEQRGGFAQCDAAEIIRDAMTLDAVEKRGHFDQFRADRNEPVLDHGA